MDYPDNLFDGVLEDEDESNNLDYEVDIDIDDDYENDDDKGDWFRAWLCTHLVGTMAAMAPQANLCSPPSRTTAWCSSSPSSSASASSDLQMERQK